MSSFNLKRYINDAGNIQNLLTSKACVTVGKSIGKGSCGTIFDIEIDDTSCEHLALKIETELNPGTNADNSTIVKEINLMSACSSLVALKKCINFIMLYGIVKIPNKKFDNVATHDTLTFEEDITNSNLNLTPITFGSIMGKIDTTSHTEKTMNPQIFWQITMALCALRTYYGQFHNDSHTGNVFLTRVGEPCDIVYNDGPKQRIVHLEKNDYYAVLGDFGLANKYPAALINQDVLSDVFTGNSRVSRFDYVSDMQRLITCSGFEGGLRPEFLKELRIVWKRIKEIIVSTVLDLSAKGNISLTWVHINGEDFQFPRSLSRGGVRIFTQVELMMISSKLKTQFMDRNSELSKLYIVEYRIVMKYAFYRYRVPVTPPGSIVCDMTSPRNASHIIALTSCDAVKPTKPCIRISEFLSKEKKICKQKK